MWLPDPKTGEKSVTVTMFTIGFVMACLKMLLSGVKLGDFSMSAFSGVDFAAVVGALGAIYAARKGQDKSG